MDRNLLALWSTVQHRMHKFITTFLSLRDISKMLRICSHFKLSMQAPKQMHTRITIALI